MTFIPWIDQLTNVLLYVDEKIVYSYVAHEIQVKHEFECSSKNANNGKGETTIIINS